MDTSTKRPTKDNPYYAKIEEEMRKRGARTGEERDKFYRDKVYNNKKDIDVQKDTKKVAPLSGYAQSFDNAKTTPKKDVNITDKIKSVSPKSGYAQRFKEDNANKKAGSLSDKIKSVSPLSPAGQKIDLNKNPDRLKELQAKKTANDTKRSADEARRFLQADDSVSQYELFNRMNNLTADDVNRLLQSETKRNTDLRNKFSSYISNSPGNIKLDEKRVLDGNISESDERIRQYRIWLTDNDLRQKAEEVKKQYGGLQNSPDYWEHAVNAEDVGGNQTYRYFTSKINSELSGLPVKSYYGGENQKNIQHSAETATRDEMTNYIYLYNTKGREAAEDYLKAIDYDLKRRWRQKRIDEAEEKGKNHIVQSTGQTIAEYVPTSIMGGIAIAKSAITGKIDVTDPFYVAVEAREAERSASANSINNESLRLVYGAVTSAADNAVAALTVGKAVSAFGGAGMSAAAKAAWTGRITGGIMSSGVAASSVLEAKKEGFSDTGALAVGIARGSIEYLSEKFSIERIMKEPTTVLKALKKSVISEGSEEVVSNWANRLVDNIINMGLTREYNELVAGGMSEKEAFLTVAEKAAYEDLESFLGGAIAGGFMTAGNLGVQTAQAGGVKNMNRVLEYQSELSKLPEDERERIIKQNEERYNKERAVEILTRDNINMGDIAGALNFLGVSDPQQAAKDIEHFKETGETSDLMRDKNVSSVVEVLATEGYFKKNSENTVSESENIKPAENVKSDSNVRERNNEEAPPINVKADPMRGVNEDAVKVITDGIGSEGRKAYYNVLERESESAYQGSEATLLRDFNRFYIKGLNGGKLSEVSGKYAKVMTERSMTEAFKAGQSDRGAMLKEKFQAVNNAVIRDGGLIRNVNSENMTNEEISQIDNLGKKFGVSIEIQDHVYNNSNKEVNGVYEAGSIILNQSKMEEFGNVKAAESFLVKHELTHRVRELAPKGFETLKSVVYNIEDRKSGTTSKAETVMTQRGVDVDTAIEEIVADHMGNEDFALEVAARDLSLAERIKGWATDILDRVGIKKYSETQRIKRLWEKACNEAKRTVKRADKRVGNDVKAAGNAKYSIGYTTNNQPVTIINDNLLENVPKDRWVAEAKKAISKFKPAIYVSGRFIKVNAMTVNEYTNSKYTDSLKLYEKTKYKDKMNAAGHLDELILTSTNYVNEDLNHNRKDSIKEFARGKTLLQIGKNQYTADIIIGFTSGKNMVLYDIINLADTNFKLNQQTVHEAMTKNSVRLSSELSADIDNISQTSANVNTGTQKNSDSDLNVTIEDIQAVQSVGRKSINDFTSEDIKKTESFARKYFKEMGVKSPFFRAWFGDWRANDTTPVKIANVKGAERGVAKNIDTGWDINVSGKVFNETKAHVHTQNVNARPYLEYINSIVQNAILLDSHTISSGKAKSQNSAIMHSLYAVADIGNGKELLKLYVEELNDVNSDGTIKRAYQLQNIESQQLSAKGSDNILAQSSSTADIHTVSQLFNLVKASDKNFSPREASKVVNEDGTPKVVYHGTKEFGFSVFDTAKSDDNSTLFFTDDKDIASTYSGKEGIVKLQDFNNVDYSDKSPHEIAEALNSIKSSDDEFMEQKYSYIDKSAFDKINASIDHNAYALMDYIESYNFDNEKENIKKTAEKLEEKLNNLDYGSISTPLYMLLHHSSVFSDSKYAKQFAELEKNVRLVNEIEKNGGANVIVGESLDGYSFYIYDIDTAKDILSKKNKMGIYAVHLNMKNPYTVECNGSNWNDITYYEVIPEEMKRFYKNGLWRHGTTREAAEYAKNEGFDGVIFKNVTDNGGNNLNINNKPVNVYVAFDSNQIKSATDNIGTFDRGNNDIRYSQGDLSEVIKENGGIENYTEEEKKNISKEGKSYINYVMDKDITLKEFFSHSRKDSGKFEKLYIGKISKPMTDIINNIFKENDIDIDVTGEHFILTNDMLNHTDKGHGINSKDSAEKVTSANIDYLKDVINSPDNILFGGFTRDGNPTIVFEKNINETTGVYVQFNSQNRNGLIGKTFYFEGKMKKGDTMANNVNDPALYAQSDHSQSPSFNNSLTQTEPNVNTGTQKNSDGDLSEVINENERLRKENEKLKELKDHYKGQMLRTPNLYSPSGINIKKIINRVAIGYTGDKKALTLQLKQAQELLSKCISVSLKADPKYTNEIYSRYREHLSLIAGDIANNTRTKNDQIYEQYRHMKDSLKGVTIKVDESWKNDLNGVDGYNDFRKSNFGVVKMSLANGTPVDVLYSELGAKFGELFPEDIATEPEQLIHITETVRAMSNFYENPYNSDMDTVIEGIADNLDLELLTLSSERTQADKYFDEAQKQIETAMEERDKAVRAIQDKYKRKIEEFKEEQRQKRENSAKRKEEATTRQKLLTLARRMKRIANNGRTTPANQALIQELIGHVDTIAVNMTGATVKNLQNLSEWYSKAAERINFVPNPRIEEDLARLDNEKIGEMNFERVMTLITALENIEKQIENENIEIGKKGDVHEKGMKTIEHINNSGGSAAYGLKNAKDAIVTGLSNPVNEIHRLTGYADDDALYQTTKDIRKSELAEVYHEMKANKLFEEYTKDKKFMKHLREDFKTFTVKQYDALGNETGEKEIRLNPAMIISLAQLAKNSGSLLHMTEGGVRIADEKIYRHGKIKEAYDRGFVVKMVAPEIRKITATLNEKDRAYMRKVEKYFNEFAKNEINAVSQQLDGIDRARVGFYYPMNTDSSFLVKEFDTIAYDASVEKQGNLKERVRNAKNPLLLMAAPDVVSRAISSNGKYIAYAIPLRNFKKLWNTMTRGELVQVPETDKYKNVKLDENGNVIMKNVYKNNYEGSVKDSVERVWGHRAVEYVENFIKDIETGRSDKTGGITKVLNFLHGNYVKAVLTVNLPVAINQVASFPSAAPVLGWKPLLMSLKDLGKVDLELISQYTGAQWNRTKGAYDPTIADAYADNKALPKILDWMMASDSIITRKLWKASEYYIRLHKPALEIGTHEYYRAVADIYETTMQETQPNSGVMERPAVLRADSATRLLMPFLGEPLKNVNLLYDAYGNMTAKKKQLDRVAGTQLQAEAEERLKEAKRNLKTTIVSQVMASAAYTVFVALARIAVGGKNGRRKYEDEDGNLTAVSILKAMGKDFLITGLTQIPFSSDLVDLITAIIKGETYNAPEMISLQALSDATEACINTASLISDLIKGDGGTWQQSIEKINNSAVKVSTLVGIPLKNVENIANSLMYWGSKTVFYNNPTMQKYAVAKFGGSLIEKNKNKKTGEIEYTATAEAKKILYNAFVNGETDNYENILFDLVDSGVKASDLESAMRELSQKDDDFAFDKSLGAFAGVKEGEDYEKYENYMKRAEKAEVSEENLRKGIDIIDSGKPYKEMYAEITSFTKDMGEKQKTFFDDIARSKYSANELGKEQYKIFSNKRKEIAETLEKQFDKSGLKNKEINDVQNKIYQYAEKTALENASNGEYRIDSEWIKQAGNSESTIGVNTAEFIKLYNKYGEKVYSEQSVITHEVGYDVNISLEYSRLKSVKGTESERDESGEIIKGKSKQDKIIAIIDGMDITDSEKAYLFSIDYKANNNNPWAGSQKVNYKKYLEQRKD